MKIGIDVRELSIGSTGISQYTLNIINYLNKCNSKLQADYFLFTNKNYKNQNLSENFHIIIDNSFSNNTIYENIRLPYLIKKFRIDKFFSPYYKMPFLSPAPCIITVHDIGFITFPLEFYARSGFYRIFARQYLKLSLKFSKKIAAVSEFTKSEIIKEFHINPDKVSVLYNSVNICFHRNVLSEKKKQIEELKKKYGYFIFSVSNYKPHKNIKKLVEAFEIIKKNSDLNLVLAGPENIWKKNLQKYIQEKNYDFDGRLFFSAPKDNEDLSVYYAAAEMLCHPSLFEGFGLPIVEAQSCGCPVVSSPAASLAEIIGDSGIIINPDSAQDIAEKICGLYNNKIVRDGLMAKGFLNAEKYRPQKSYSEIINLLTS